MVSGPAAAPLRSPPVPLLLVPLLLVAASLSVQRVWGRGWGPPRGPAEDAHTHRADTQRCVLLFVFEVTTQTLRVKPVSC